MHPRPRTTHWPIKVRAPTNPAESPAVPQCWSSCIQAEIFWTAILDRKQPPALSRHHSTMHSVIRPNAWVALKLPSGSTKVLQIAPNT
jgi:hypothetical protein